MKIAGGHSEYGVAVGNTYDKYSSTNPIAKLLMKGFSEALTGFVEDAGPGSFHDVGCGEGYWTLAWAAQGHDVKGTDFSTHAIGLARSNALERGLSPTIFETRSIYELDPASHSADLVVCCEVLEHVMDPERAMRALQGIVSRELILSVPREPLWRVLNVMRGTYLSDWGNTPGHVNHWSTHQFREFVSQYFDILSIASPLPWTMLRCRPKS